MATYSPLARQRLNDLATPSATISPFPLTYRDMGMVMILLWGIQARQSWGGCYLDPPEGNLGIPGVSIL
jgi:hypothetical protein